MITSDLIDYIKIQLNNNFSKDSIIEELLNVGWRLEDINEGFNTLASFGFKPITGMPKLEENKITENNFIANNSVIENKYDSNKVDPYRELPIVADETQVIEEKTPVISNIDKIKPIKVWEPIKIEPQKEEDTKVETLIVIPKVEEKEVQIVDLVNKVETTKAWTPIVIHPKVVENTPLKIPEDKQQDSNIEFSSIKTIEPFNLELESKENKQEQEKNEFIPTISKHSFEGIQNKIQNSTIIPQNTNTYTAPIKPITNTNTAINLNIAQNKINGLINRNAIISSYTQDVLAAKKEEIVPKKKKNFIRMGIIVTIFALLGLMVFAFVEGYIKIPGSSHSFSVVRKDPRTIIINAPKTISSLKSYKVETRINLSSPSLSSITTGLSTGDNVAAGDRDYIKASMNGSLNNKEGLTAFDYLLNFKSSLLDNDIDSNIKSNGEDIYVTVPDLSVILGKNSPQSTTLSLKQKEIGLVIPEFSSSVQSRIKEFDIYNILSGKLPVYVKKETGILFKDFISKLEYIPKEDEIIKGVDTYHYEFTAGRLSTKKLLTDIMNLFVVKMSQTQKSNLEEALGSSIISGFEVWVGKNDDNLYQIKFTITTPLSKVLALNDSGIANNEVTLDWITTYYDIDVPNDISLPEAEYMMDGFIKNIRDIKIKNIISSFKIQAAAFKNSVGSYGKRPNTAGSCANPNPGSIFSPTGHTKGANGAISTISSTMNSLLSTTNGAGSCYSTSGSWAISAPLLTTTDDAVINYFCSDNKGNSISLLNPITGPICK